MNNETKNVSIEVMGNGRKIYRVCEGDKMTGKDFFSYKNALEYAKTIGNKIWHFGFPTKNYVIRN